MSNFNVISEKLKLHQALGLLRKSNIRKSLVINGKELFEIKSIERFEEINSINKKSYIHTISLRKKYKIKLEFEDFFDNNTIFLIKGDEFFPDNISKFIRIHEIHFFKKNTEEELEVFIDDYEIVDDQIKILHSYLKRCKNEFKKR